MKIKAVLFDLDGTLLPMDQEVFVKAYFGSLAKFMAPHGYDPKDLVSSVWQGTDRMLANDGKKTNEAVFWDFMAEKYGEAVRADEEKFRVFYETQFDKISEVCGFTPRAKDVIDAVKAKGLRTSLLTNPIFPEIATEKRIKWAGLSLEDFELITTYENSSHCKPTAEYYMNSLSKLGLSPEECLMVGNDVGDDMPAEGLGMKVFLLTDCLINSKNSDIGKYPHGGFDELINYIESI